MLRRPCLASGWLDTLLSPTVFLWQGGGVFFLPDGVAPSWVRCPVCCSASETDTTLAFVGSTFCGIKNRTFRFSPERVFAELVSVRTKACLDELSMLSMLVKRKCEPIFPTCTSWTPRPRKCGSKELHAAHRERAPFRFIQTRIGKPCMQRVVQKDTCPLFTQHEGHEMCDDSATSSGHLFTVETRDA